MKIVVLGAGTAGLITALILREKYPTYPITIIKSDTIGIVGVGEGSTEHWAWFMNYVNINNLELLHETKATVKIGILFKDWHSGPDYVHSISTFELSSLNRPELFHHLYLCGIQEDFPLSPHFKPIYFKHLVPTCDNFRSSNQYHFDTFKLGSYLSKICVDRDIIIEDKIEADDVIGYITTVLRDEVFIMSSDNLKKFKTLYDFPLISQNKNTDHGWMKNFIINYMKQNLEMDNIVPGRDQEVARPSKIKQICIENYQVNPSIFSRYGISKDYIYK